MALLQEVRPTHAAEWQEHSGDGALLEKITE
jgi:hypothetical protein